MRSRASTGSTRSSVEEGQLLAPIDKDQHRNSAEDGDGGGGYASAEGHSRQLGRGAGRPRHCPPQAAHEPEKEGAAQSADPRREEQPATVVDSELQDLVDG